VKQGRGDSTTGDGDRTQGSKQGGPANKRPSDPGGQGQGSPTAGGKKRSGAFNESQKSIGHTEEWWIKTLTKGGDLSTSDARDMVQSWESEYKKSGTIYFPTTAEEDDSAPGLADTVRRKKARLKTKYVIRREGLPDMEITKSEEDDEEPAQDRFNQNG